MRSRACHATLLVSMACVGRSGEHDDVGGSPPSSAALPEALPVTNDAARGGDHGAPLAEIKDASSPGPDLAREEKKDVDSGSDSRPLPEMGAAAAVLAFPGAVGYGAQAVGGRRGRVLLVTSLADRGPGTLREAIETHGPRMVLLRTGGTITLESPLIIRQPYLTIAGQTAPGDGITVRTNGFGSTSVEQSIAIRTHDVIIRFLRIRPAPTRDGSWLNATGPWTAAAHEVIIDHISASSGSKDAMNSWFGAQGVTFQRSILAEGLKTNGHKGALVGGGSERITFFQNLFAHNVDRNPWVKADEGEGRDATATVARFQIVNNIIYNCGTAVRVGAVDSPTWAPAPGQTHADVIGNYVKVCPNTQRGWHEILVGKRARVFVRGNVGPRRTNEDLDDWAVVGLDWAAPDRRAAPGTPAPYGPFASNQPLTPAIPALPAAQAYLSVLANVGATRPQRDNVDERIITDVRSGSTGAIIDTPGQVGGWPVIATGTPLSDTDTDGMPDTG